MKIPYRVRQTFINIRLKKYRSLKRNFHNCENENIAVFYMGQLIPDRRTVQVYRQLTMSGYSCYLYFEGYKKWMKAAFLHNWRYSELLFENGFVTTFPSKFNLLVCSHFDSPNIYCGSKIMRINDQIMDRLLTLRNKEFFYPILFHPTKMNLEFEKKALSSKIKNRKISIIFIGNVNIEYNKAQKNIHKKYNTYSRVEVLEFLEEKCKDLVFKPENIDELKKAIQSGSIESKIVIISNFRLNGEDYEKTLMQSCFFLHNTGVDIPFCHNQIESAACGCIPITNFAQYYPELKNEENCITYKNLDELAIKCRLICEKSIDSNHIQDMSFAIKEWYNKHFSFDSFKGKMGKFMSSGEKIADYYVFKELSPLLGWIDKHTFIHF